MNWIIKWSKIAKKHLERHQADLQNRIDFAILNMLKYFNGEKSIKPEIRSLKGKYRGLLRLTVGDYRVIFSIDYRKPEIFIIDVLPKSDAYKK